MSALSITARALLEAVDFDQHGRMVAGLYRGGNGGLLSIDTIRAADALRMVLENGEPSPLDDPTPRDLALATEFCAKINRTGRIEPGGLLDMAKRLHEAGDLS